MCKFHRKTPVLGVRRCFIVECANLSKAFFRPVFSSWSHYICNIKLRDHSFSAYEKFSEKLTFPTPWTDTFVLSTLDYSTNYFELLYMLPYYNVTWLEERDNRYWHMRIECFYFNYPRKPLSRSLTGFWNAFYSFRKLTFSNLFAELIV